MVVGMSTLPGYDAWKTGPFGRFERDQERRSDRYSLALSERDNELREDGDLMVEAFAEYTQDPIHHRRLALILKAAACHHNVRCIGDALTRLVNEIIKADSERYADKEASR